ncbi:MAG: PAS domain S-box protein [Phycisphaeraceae bacterium]
MSQRVSPKGGPGGWWPAVADVGQGMCLLAPDGRLREVNPACAALLGQGETDLRGRCVLDFIHPQDRHVVEAELKRIEQGEPSPGFECRCIDERDTAHWLEWLSLPMPAGGPVWMVVHEVSDRREAAERLTENEKKLRAIIQSSSDAIYMKDVDGRYVLVNQAALDLAGLNKSDAVGRTDADLWPPHIARQAADSDRRAMRTGRRIQIEYALPLNGQMREFLGSKWVHTSVTGEPLGIIGMLRDITDRKQAERALRESEARFRSAFDGAAVGMCLVSLDGHFLHANEAMSRILGYELDELKNLYTHDVTHPDDVAPDREQQQRMLAGEFDHYQIDKRYIRKDGQVIHAWLAVSLVRDDEGAPLYCVGQIQDITSLKKSEARLRHDAMYDSLTGLANRKLLLSRLGDLLHRRRDEPFAVLYLDFDRFKLINDSLGHETGDLLLKEIARRFEEHLPERALAARIGGDEFVVVLPRTPAVEAAEAVAKQMLKVFAEPYELAGHEVCSTASIGLVHSEHGYDNPADMLRDADTAMYQAKLQGKARYVIFDAKMHEEAVRRLQLEQDMRRAVLEQRFEVEYQPIVNLQDGQLVGFEALLRWQHRDLGQVPANQFMSVAEDSGLIVPIGRWTIHRVCRDLAKWQRDYPERSLRVHVNIAGRQFGLGDLLGDIGQAIRLSQADPAGLVLELSERSLSEQLSRSPETFTELAELGVRLAVEDLGLGHSCLSWLHELPVACMKIGSRLLGTLEKSREHGLLVQTIVTVAHKLDIVVAAVGIESAAQLAQLQALECDEAQGYYFAEPMPAERAERLLSLDAPPRRWWRAARDEQVLEAPGCD